jgi:hypothetical protein
MPWITLQEFGLNIPNKVFHRKVFSDHAQRNLVQDRWFKDVRHGLRDISHVAAKAV